MTVTFGTDLATPPDKTAVATTVLNGAHHQHFLLYDGSGNIISSSNALPNTIYDSSGNEIASHLQTDGKYHLGIAASQNVYDDPNNSSTDNLDAANSYTFTGTGTSTLGVVGLQWSLKTDQNATVYIEESDDNSNWDISYPFDYIAAKGGRGETVQATKAYWRIRVVLTGTTDTTYFRLSGVLCPIAVPLPSELSSDGRLKSETTLVGQQNTERHVWVNPTNELAISPVYRLVGTTFIGNTIDSNFWTSAVANNGTVTQSDGLVELKTSATSDGEATLTSVRKGRFVSGSAMIVAGGVNWVTAATASNVRRVGAYTATDGYFFELNGTTFSVGTRIGSSDTLVNTGSFNGNIGDSWTPTANTYYKITIEWSPIGVLYYINGVLLHKTNGAGLTATTTLPIKIENDNGAITTDISFKCIGLYIARQGELVTNPTSVYQAGTTAGLVAKYGAGVLRGVVVSGVANNCIITLYDNTAASGTILWSSGSMGAQTQPYSLDFHGLPFSTGLTLVIASANCNVTLIYE